AALDHVHDVKWCADDGFVLAQAMNAGNREAGLPQRGDDAIFAIDGMGPRQQFARRLAAEHIGSPRRVEAIGRVRLAALELADRKRAAKALNIVLEPADQCGLVEA